MTKAQLITEVTRKCRSCIEVKPLTDFTRRTKALQGRESQCKACRSKARYESGAYLRERFRKHQYRHNSNMFYTDVTINAVLTATNCCYCNDELTREKEHAKQATLDHVYPGANIDENIVICCRSCNTSKGQLHVYDFYQSSEKFTDELFRKFLKTWISRMIGREISDHEVDEMAFNLRAESEEIRAWHENRRNQLDKVN